MSFNVGSLVRSQRTNKKTELTRNDNVIVVHTCASGSSDLDAQQRCSINVVYYYRKNAAGGEGEGILVEIIVLAGPRFHRYS